MRRWQCWSANHLAISVTMMPLGHTAIYLDRVCADGPLKVRMCHAGEPQGVVLSRYYAIGKYDWLATPVMQFLYATR